MWEIYFKSKSHDIMIRFRCGIIICSEDETKQLNGMAK